MTTRPSRPLGHTAALWQRGLLALAGLATVGAAIALGRDRLTHIEELTQHLAAFGVSERRPALAPQVKREVDPERRQLEVARALVGDALDPSAWFAAGSTDELAQRMLQRLAVAHELASAVLHRQPDSWRANLYAGASTYLSWTLQRDERLVREVEAWRTPLERARALAPHQPEPKTFMTLAQLELWQMLSEQRREETRLLLADAWTKTPIDHRILAAWLRVAPKDDSILDPLPPDPRLLRAAQAQLAADLRWDLVIDARMREKEAVATRLTDALRAGTGMLARGNLRLARWTMGRGTPVEPTLELVEEMERLVTLLPAGPVPEIEAAVLRKWLLWALDLDLYGGSSFTPRTLERLARLANLSDAAARLRLRLVVSGAEAAEQERARLDAADNLALYGVHLAKKSWSERHDGASSDAESAPLSLAAAQTVGDAAPREHAVLWQVVSRPRTAPESPLLSNWMQTTPGVLELEIWLPYAVDLVVLPSAPFAGGGSAIEVLWNQQLLGTFQRFSAQPPLRLSHLAPRGVHRLQVRNLAGAQFRPGTPTFETAQR